VAQPIFSAHGCIGDLAGQKKPERREGI